MEQISFGQLLERLFHTRLWGDASEEKGIAIKKIRELYFRDDVSGLVLFENQQMDSSAHGSTSAMCFGPGDWTLKSWADAEGKWLNDLPSQRQYPVAYVLKNDEAQRQVVDV